MNHEENIKFWFNFSLTCLLCFLNCFGRRVLSVIGWIYDLLPRENEDCAAPDWPPFEEAACPSEEVCLEDQGHSDWEVEGVPDEVIIG